MQPSATATLALCRTPFQAVILREVLRIENPGAYDLVYMTQDDSAEDRHYFRELSANASAAQFLYVPRQRFDILNHVKAYLAVEDRFKTRRYTAIFTASLNSLVFRKLLARHADTRLVSFDDGAGNVISNSMFLRDWPGVRAALYENCLGVPSLPRVRQRAALHYSVYPEFDHMMAPTPIRYVNPFSYDQPVDQKAPPVAFLIGQPFREYLTAAAVERLKAYFVARAIDYYVPHPRERTPLLEQVPVVEKSGRVAEEAILAVCAGRRPILYGGFTAVMLNLPAARADKIMVLDADTPGIEHYERLGERAGCQIVRLGGR